MDEYGAQEAVDLSVVDKGAQVPSEFYESYSLDFQKVGVLCGIDAVDALAYEHAGDGQDEQHSQRYPLPGGTEAEHEHVPVVLISGVLQLFAP